MKLYCEGSENAFRALYARYASRIKAFIVRRLSVRHAESANDLVQITWLKVHGSRTRFDPGKKFASWIFTIALNTIRDFVSESRHRIEIGMDPSEIEPHSTHDDGELIFERVDKQRLARALESIPSLQRDVVLLSDGEGFNSVELSKMLGISDSAVRQSLFRGRKRLREILGVNE